MPRHRTVFVPLALLALLVGSTYHAPTLPRALAADDCQTFAPTGKRVCGEFLAYWQTHGGLAQQGYPISDVFSERSDTDGGTYPVQYFERAVFEWHAELPPGQRVVLSLLGVQQYRARYGGTPPGSTAVAAAATTAPPASVAALASLTPPATATSAALAAGLAVPPTVPVATTAAAPTAGATAPGPTPGATLPGPPPGTTMGIAILQQGCATGYRTVACGFLLRNTTAMTWGVVTLAYTLYDSGGAVVVTDTAYAYAVHGGERVGTASVRPRPDNVVPTRVEVRVVSVTPLGDTPDSAPLTTQMAQYLPGDDTPQVVGTVGNPNGAITGRVEVHALLFDDAGGIVGAGSAIVNALPDHGQRAVTVPVTGPLPARVELFAAPYVFAG